MSKTIWKKAIATSLALLMVSGAVPLKPVTDLASRMAVTAYAAGEPGVPVVPTATVTVTWKNWDGTVLEEKDINKITFRTTSPAELYAGSTPTKPEDENYTYQFSNWTLTENTDSAKTFTAQFDAIPKNGFTVTWQNYDSTVLETRVYAAGEMPVYHGETPVRNSVGSVYTFVGWTPEISAVSEDVIYTAVFVKTVWATVSLPEHMELCDESILTDGKVKVGTTVRFRVSEGYAAVGKVKHSYTINSITYSFVLTPDENGVYSVNWNADSEIIANIKKLYTVTWNDAEGSLLKTTTVLEGEIPSFGDGEPTKASDEKYDYVLEWTPALTAASADATYTASFNKVPKAAHFSQNGDTYTIHDATGWEIFCDLIEGGETFSGKTVKLGADITVSTMAGSRTNPFKGSFDGQKHTLTVTISGSTGGEAVFSGIDGATIKDLTLSGSITGGQHCGALVGFASGTNTIENVNVTADVSLDSGISAGKAHHGGVIGHALSSNTTLRGVVYSGTISSTEASNNVYVGGLIGWCDNAQLTIENSIFVGTYNGGTLFHPVACKYTKAGGSLTCTNVYYTVEPTSTSTYTLSGTSKLAHSITAGENVTIGYGTGTEYDVSGITAYGTGLAYNGNFYAGEGDEVALTLGNTKPAGYTFKGYSVNAGTLENGTLTMPDENVTVNAAFEQIITYTLVPAMPATCTAPGNIEYYIGADGKYYVLTDGAYVEIEEDAWVIEVSGHDYAESRRENEVAPTYTTEGSYEVIYSCSRCGDEYSETVVVPMLEKTAVVINSVDINGIKTPTTVYAETYADGDYTVPSAPYLDGYTFNGWKVNGTPCTTAEAVQTAVAAAVAEKPESVTVAVDYEKLPATYTVTVVNGTLKNGETSGSYQVSEQLYAVASATNADGQKFSCWKVGEKIVGYETTYAFRMPSADMTLTAEYVAAETAIEKVGTGYIESVKRPAANKLSFVSILSVPDGCQMLKAGVVVQSTETLGGAELTKENAKLIKFSDTSKKHYSSFKYTWTMSTSNHTKQWTVRPYLEYTDANGDTQVIYGDAVSKCVNDVSM